MLCGGFILKHCGGQDTTLKIVVEPFGLRAADVARPPPRVGVARRAPQHRGLLPPSSLLIPSTSSFSTFASSFYSSKPSSSTSTAATPACAALATRLGVGAGPGGPRSEKRRGGGHGERHGEIGGRGQVRRRGWPPAARGGGWVWAVWLWLGLGAGGLPQQK